MFLGKKKVDIELSVKTALFSVFGLGKTRINYLLSKLGGSRLTPLINIHQNKLEGLSAKILKHYSTENDLKTPVRKLLQSHYLNGSYKGIRFTQGLPANGQRTKTNANTAGRIRRVAVAIKTKKT
jgi:ribosomal protein S13